MYRSTFGSGGWTALDLDGPDVTNYVKKTGDTITGTLTINAGASYDKLIISSSGDDVYIGRSANGGDSGVAVGDSANGYDHAVGIGCEANGSG